MRDPLGLSPRSFNNLNSYNPTKDSLLNTQIRHTGPYIETPEGGQVEQKGEVKKDMGLIQARDSPPAQLGELTALLQELWLS